MSEFEQFRCMISFEDTKDEGPAYCNYPKCWLGECPHKQARDCLAESALREQSLMLQLGERDKRLAEAEGELMGADSEIQVLEAYADTLKDRLAEAEKLPEIWKEKARGWEDQYDRIRNHALENCARELETVLRGEAED